MVSIRVRVSSGFGIKENTRVGEQVPARHQRHLGDLQEVAAKLVGVRDRPEVLRVATVPDESGDIWKHIERTRRAGELDALDGLEAALDVQHATGVIWGFRSLEVYGLGFRVKGLWFRVKGV